MDPDIKIDEEQTSEVLELEGEMGRIECLPLLVNYQYYLLDLF